MAQTFSFVRNASHGEHEVADVHQVHERDGHLGGENGAVIAKAVGVQHHVARLVEAAADALDDGRRHAGDEASDGAVEDVVGVVAEVLLRAGIEV